MLSSAKELINRHIQNEEDFIFIFDFELKKPIVLSFSEIEIRNIFFKIDKIQKLPPFKDYDTEIKIEKYPIPFQTYEDSFNFVLANLKAGNSYLTNLTFPTRIEINTSLENIFLQSEAKYKLLYDDQFVVFSPEPFCKIENGKIYSFPMKGTINAAISNAEQLILSNPKEAAEHATIVDLIRNDLSIWAENVVVENYRYIEKVKTQNYDLLQVSSCISGKLPIDFQDKFADILFSILPAGSVSGAPKPKTCEIIRKTEMGERGYYTGVFGYYSKGKMESAVMIRYIEKTKDGFQFRSGGGITAMSNAKEEYQELIDKVYVNKCNNFSPE